MSVKSDRLRNTIACRPATLAPVDWLSSELSASSLQPATGEVPFSQLYHRYAHPLVLIDSITVITCITLNKDTVRYKSIVD